MSEIKNGGLDQYGKVWSLNVIGGERVKFCKRKSLIFNIVWASDKSENRCDMVSFGAIDNSNSKTVDDTTEFL